MEKLPPQKKMSREAPQNMEEIVWRWRNILVLGVKHGETATTEENVPENATIPGEMAAAVGKHPGFWRKTWRKCHRRRRMSRKQPQNRGKDVRFRGLSGTFVNVKTD